MSQLSDHDSVLSFSNSSNWEIRLVIVIVPDRQEGRQVRPIEGRAEQ
jgi:hypothetical protein